MVAVLQFCYFRHLAKVLQTGSMEGTIKKKKIIKHPSMQNHFPPSFDKPATHKTKIMMMPL